MTSWLTGLGEHGNDWSVSFPDAVIKHWQRQLGGERLFKLTVASYSKSQQG